MHSYGRGQRYLAKEFQYSQASALCDNCHKDTFVQSCAVLRYVKNKLRVTLQKCEPTQTKLCWTKFPSCLKWVSPLIPHPRQQMLARDAGTLTHSQSGGTLVEPFIKAAWRFLSRNIENETVQLDHSWAYTRRTLCYHRAAWMTVLTAVLILLFLCAGCIGGVPRYTRRGQRTSLSSEFFPSQRFWGLN